jgi:hypothetical protein
MCKASYSFQIKGTNAPFPTGVSWNTYQDAFGFGPNVLYEVAVILVTQGVVCSRW